VVPGQRLFPTDGNQDQRYRDGKATAASAAAKAAILLITGSGQQDRDEMLWGHKPFAVIADNLTKRGFLVLRVDDRGMGKTTGDFSQATSLDFAKDVEAGLDFLEAQPEVNKENIGLLGHSEGGLIAPIVANERKEVKGASSGFLRVICEEINKNQDTATFRQGRLRQWTTGF